MKQQEQLQLLEPDDLALRLDRLDFIMGVTGTDTVVVCSNANLYYLCGRVFCGFILYHRGSRRPVYFVRRPVTLTGKDIVPIHKPEQIAEHLGAFGLEPLGTTALETDSRSYSQTVRLAKALGLEKFTDADSIFRRVRAVKTPAEIKRIKYSGECQERVYREIPRLYREGMSDIELQIEIEHASRLEGCLGLFRVAGNEMELFMANILAGDNADTPSPYDFAMGGAGADPSLPVGANGTIITPGQSVMVDANGNYSGYMTDMTRTFAPTPLPDEAMRAHQLSIDICKELAQMGRNGVAASMLYEKAVSMVEEAGLQDYFMGHRQHAGFIGHGVGIEINELPVISPRSRDILESGNIIALEPKFVIPHVGAVGIENTYLVNEDGPMTCLTNADEQIRLLAE